MTYINGEVVQPGSSKELTHGSVISFSCSPSAFTLVLPFHAEANPSFHRVWDEYQLHPTTVSKEVTLDDVGFNEAWDSLPHEEMEPSESEREKHRADCWNHFNQMLCNKGEDVTRESIEQWRVAVCFWRRYFLSGQPE